MNGSTRETLLKAGFTVDEIGDLPADIKGRKVILDPVAVRPEFRTKANLVWEARGGFGCRADSYGHAIFADCLGDGESARWSKGDFIAEYLGGKDTK